MSEENLDIPMAQCGACDSIVPLDSESCPNCGIRFGGVTDEQLGECGACSAIIPADSESCPECGVSFVAVEEPASEATVEDTQAAPITDNLEDLNDIILPETESVEEAVEEEQPAAEEEEVVEEAAEETLEEASSEEETESDVVEEDTPVDEVETDSITDDTVEVDSHEEAVSDGVEEESAEDDVEEESTTGDVDIESLIDDVEEALADELAEVNEADEDVEEPEEDGIDDGAVAMAFDNLALAIADSGMTAAEAFGEIDTSEDQMIDAPELQKGIEKIAGEKLSPKHVTAILNYLDKDGNRRVDPAELIKALEDLRIGIQPGKMPKVKTFPSPTQKFLMGKKANDIVYPIAYFLMVTFIGLWVVNGVGLLVDGTGGTIVYEGGVDQFGDDIEVTNWNLCTSDALDELPDPCFGTVEVGQTYPCDPAVDENKCANSLTPFSGENGASSMPAGFYGDGVAMIILGVIGLAITAYLHLIYAPALRDKVREKSGKSASEDSEEEEDDQESEEVEEEEDESALEAPKDLEIDDGSDDEDEYEDDDEDDSEDEDDEDYDDDIDVGDWIGLEVDGEEFFGEIVEFDDDEGTVTIETEDGEEITGDQDDMFLEDEDDE
tara:strand:+ start:369 stop:2201 length:1833 start_codon:yes stop_codon:yes gene_type:complete